VAHAQADLEVKVWARKTVGEMRRREQAKRRRVNTGMQASVS
jgi:hypothetical protein